VRLANSLITGFALLSIVACQSNGELDTSLPNRESPTVEATASPTPSESEAKASFSEEAPERVSTASVTYVGNDAANEMLDYFDTAFKDRWGLSLNEESIQEYTVAASGDDGVDVVPERCADVAPALLSGDPLTSLSSVTASYQTKRKSKVEILVAIAAVTDDSNLTGRFRECRRVKMYLAEDYLVNGKQITSEFAWRLKEADAPAQFAVFVGTQKATIPQMLGLGLDVMLLDVTYLLMQEGENQIVGILQQPRRAKRETIFDVKSFEIPSDSRLTRETFIADFPSIAAAAMAEAR